MERIIGLLLSFCLTGCATSGYPIAKQDVYKTEIGMTIGQVYKQYGSPDGWTRQVIDGKTYESLTYPLTFGSYDFVDGILIGYAKRGFLTGKVQYFSKDKVEDIKNFK